ncbi:MAG TPA: tRNA (adenosine(37)-N6)-dimethylallyltransferase MiaA [Kiritimatiellia bacterium]|nr:tRNA (adenosine(37)-N6)-dimethylallyltransferase MiaA [Kiritimatiellia bacterium]
MIRKGWMVVGPTAAGKTEVVHELARAWGTWILSADSMLVYRGMDVGTAKPTRRQREEIRYEGVDVAEPDESFSLSRYLDHVRSLPADLWATPPIVAGGTGLYVSGLLRGLKEQAPPDVEYRTMLRGVVEEKGVAGLQALCREQAPGVLESLADGSNPRRLMRAMEQARAGTEPDRSWREMKELAPVAGLDRSREDLGRRIEARARRMFEEGLVEEARGLRERYPHWSETAGQAIGYREALGMLEGRLTEAEAFAEVVRRTRQLAKRQRTWFRHQVAVEWILAGEADATFTTVKQLEECLLHHDCHVLDL